MSKISNIIQNGQRKLHYIECTLLGGVIAHLVRMKKYDIYAWGNGIECLVSFLRDNDIEVKAIIESDPIFRKKSCIFERFVLFPVRV